VVVVVVEANLAATEAVAMAAGASMLLAVVAMDVGVIAPTLKPTSSVRSVEMRDTLQFVASSALMRPTLPAARRRTSQPLLL
jgi:hypothetical protein